MNKKKNLIDDEVFIIDDDIKKKTTKKHFRLKKKFVFLILIFFLVVGLTTGYIIYKNRQERKRILAEERRIMKINEIKGHYGENVKVKNDSDIYNEKEKVIGKIYKDIEVSLEEIEEITDETKYFKIEGLGLINYENVEPISELTKYSDRYKKYIPFNKNVVLKEGYTLYDDKGNKAYSFNEGDEYPILVNDYEGKYYVEYQNQLVYVLKDDVLKIVDHDNTKKKNASRVTTLCYHRIYDTKDKCDDSYICLKKSSFDQQMKYLKDNNYLTLTMEEMYLYLTKKLQVEKAVLVTMDDGYLWESAIEIYEKYGLIGNGFIITGRFKDYKGFESDYFTVQSHTDAMHTAGVCKKEYSYQQGGGILCLNEDKILNDLKTSREKLDNQPIALAYPFYDYNSRAMNLVEKAGFKMAFAGAGSTNGKSSPGTNLYKIPRMTIWNTTSFSKWKSYL